MWIVELLYPCRPCRARRRRRPLGAGCQRRCRPRLPPRRYGGHVLRRLPRRVPRLCSGRFACCRLRLHTTIASLDRQLLRAPVIVIYAMPHGSLQVLRPRRRLMLPPRPTWARPCRRRLRPPLLAQLWPWPRPRTVALLILCMLTPMLRPEWQLRHRPPPLSCPWMPGARRRRAGVRGPDAAPLLRAAGTQPAS